MAVNCQALSVVPAWRAIRRQIKVAAEPVMSRSGPMAVAMNPGKPVRTGRLPAVHQNALAYRALGTAMMRRSGTGNSARNSASSRSQARAAR